MWFKGFIVAALTAALTVGPFAGRIARADPPEVVNWEKVASDLATVPGIENLGSLATAAQADVVQTIEGKMADPGCEDCKLRDLGIAMDGLCQSAWGRSRTAGEFAIAVATDLPLGQTVESSTKFGELLEITKLSVAETHDLSQPAVRDYFNAMGYGLVTAQYGVVARVVVLVTGDSTDRFVDAVMFGPKAGDEATGILLIPLSSSDAAAGTLPPTVSVALSWGSWACAFTGLIFAFTLASCFGGVGGCLAGCIPCCIHEAGGCCAAWTAGYGYYNFCFGGTPSTALEVVNDVINNACFFIPYP